MFPHKVHKLIKTIKVDVFSVILSFFKIDLIKVNGFNVNIANQKVHDGLL